MDIRNNDLFSHDDRERFDTLINICDLIEAQPIYIKIKDGKVLFESWSESIIHAFPNFDLDLIEKNGEFWKNKNEDDLEKIKKDLTNINSSNKEIIHSVYKIYVNDIEKLKYLKINLKIVKKDGKTDHIIGYIKNIDDEYKRNHDFINNLTYMKTLADIYFSTHVLNLKYDTVEELKTNEQVLTKVNKSDHAYNQMIEIVKYTITESHLQEALNFTDLHTLKDRLKGKKIISEDFLGKFNGWTRFQFLTNSYDENGEIETVIFSTRIIDSEKKNELELLKYSLTDGLTNLYNRRAYEQDLIKERKNCSDIIIFAFDINGLKKANDILGHVAGDELIISTSKLLNETFNDSSKIYRTGGDEFVVIMHGNEKNAEELVEAFRKKVHSWSGVLNKNISISIGYALYNELNDNNLERLANLADYRMYEDKNKYYNR